jgi:hypothetical protein
MAKAKVKGGSKVVDPGRDILPEVEAEVCELPFEYGEAELFAKMFLDRLEQLKKVYREDRHLREIFDWTPSKERASLKRISLELTKALAKMRR